MEHPLAARGNDGELDIAVLGPLTVRVDRRVVPLPTGRLRTVLAVLAMSPGRPVPVKRLAEAVWSDEPPVNAKRTLQTYVARLRAVLGGGAIATHPAGYLLRTEPDRVDAVRFDRLLDEVASAADPADERSMLADALALWRGEPFADVASDWLATGVSARLRERYVGAVERNVDLDLADGRHQEAVARLSELVVRFPLRESLWARLLTALHRAGRHAEALRSYETVRGRLADELGTDPGPELRQLHADLLATGRGRSSAPRVPVDRRPVVPHQLPADAGGFVGRDAALTRLDHLLRHGSTDRPVVISAIAGAGKTSLAVHWAHLAADAFPDGQLFINLKGFDPSGRPMEPTEAVRSLLEALNVPKEHVPTGADAQVGLYRSVLAGKRVLLVLDNARSAEQVRPLLPGNAECAVVITSRNRLPGLVASENAHPLTLDVFTADEARRLLARRIGPHRVTAEADAADAIVAACGRLPLALTIMAARAVLNPEHPLARLAALPQDEERLDPLDREDAATNLRAVFSWSYEAIGPEAADLFRSLGAVPGPDVSIAGVASLARVPPRRARSLLVELTMAHMLTETTPDRYAFHDLLRGYANELAVRHDPPERRRATARRLLDHYAHSAHHAARLMQPNRHPIALDPPDAHVVVERPTDHGHALDWFRVNRETLVSAVRFAADNGFESHCFALTWSLTDFLNRVGYGNDAVAIGAVSVDAMTRRGDRRALASAHRGLARSLTLLGRYAEARPHAASALALYAESGDRAGEADAQLGMASWFTLQDRHAEALPHAERALELFRATGFEAGTGMALNNIGWFHAVLGDHETAATYCRQALEHSLRIGDRLIQASALDSLGYIHHRRGDHGAAEGYYRQALEVSTELRDRRREATTLGHLADVCLATGREAAAREYRARARAIRNELDRPAP